MSKSCGDGFLLPTSPGPARKGDLAAVNPGSARKSEGPMRKLLALGAVVVGAVIVVRGLLQSERGGARRQLGAVRQRIMARMLEGMPPDSPPKLVMSILPRLQQQNDEIIALLREQNELLQRARSQPVIAEKSDNE
jgi:hypothetical protein